MLDEVRLLLVEEHPWYPRMLSRCVRLPAHEDQERGCLWWCGARSRGGERSSDKAWYGSLNLGPEHGRRVVRTHVAVATAHGLIQDFLVPPGMNLDHSCRRSLCVEEAHLEVVTKLENQRRKRLPERPLTAHEVDLIALRHVALGDAPWWWADERRRSRG